MNGWTGANHVTAPVAPSARSTSLLHTGHPTAKNAASAAGLPPWLASPNSDSSESALRASAADKGSMRAPAGSEPVADNDNLPEEKPLRVISHCVASELRDPRSALLIAALLPQFLSPASPFLPQAAILGGLLVFLSATTSLVYAMMADKVRKTIRKHVVRRTINRSGGTVLIAAVVQATEMLVRATSPLLHELLGVFLPLITTNCAVLGVALLNLDRQHGLLESLVFGAAAAADPAPTVDVKTLHAKIGELTLTNDFLAGALTKAGLLSAKR